MDRCDVVAFVAENDAAVPEDEGGEDGEQGDVWGESDGQRPESIR